MDGRVRGGWESEGWMGEGGVEGRVRRGGWESEEGWMGE